MLKIELVQLCESEKREHFDLSLDFPLPKIGLFFPVFILLLFSQSFSAKTKCKFEFPDYSSCGLNMSKLNQSVRAFLIRTVKNYS